MSGATDVRLDRLFTEVSNLVPLDGIELLTPSVVHGVVPQSTLDSRPQQALRDGYLVNRAQPNDFVISMSSHAHGIELCEINGGISPDYTLLRPKCDLRLVPFLKYALKSRPIIHQFSAFKTGIRMGLRLQWNKVRYCKINVPDLTYAIRSAAYLDREARHIDALISMKTKFIELLREKVTAGIDTAIQPRASWAQVPFWSIATPKSVVDVADEGLLSVYLDRGVIPYSEGGGLVHKPAESLDKYQLVEPGDFVMNNQQAWRGSVGVSTHRGIVSPAYLIFSLDKKKIDPAFANYAFRSKSYVEQFMLASMGVGDIQRQIKWHLLRKVGMSLPMLEEQQAITARLDREKIRIDLLVSKTERSIALLKERRSALITAAVTGKIDVRGLSSTFDVKDAA